ncbi:MAG: nitroreductase family protein [Defluviitaleaceae bacterium]|nr:nitroreductase family protein [Defluviitaleaceae bacterium]
MWDNEILIDKLFLSRKSERNFSNKIIDKSLIDILINVGNSAPKAGGVNCISIVPILDKKDILFCYKATFYQESVKNAPLIFLVTTNKEKLNTIYKEPHLSNFLLQNASLAAMNIITACQLYGISTCYIGGLRYNYIEQFLNLSKEEKVIIMLLVGYKSC